MFSSVMDGNVFDFSQLTKKSIWFSFGMNFFSYFYSLYFLNRVGNWIYHIFLWFSIYSFLCVLLQICGVFINLDDLQLLKQSITLCKMNARTYSITAKGNHHYEVTWPSMKYSIRTLSNKVNRQNEYILFQMQTFHMNIKTTKTFSTTEFSNFFSFMPVYFAMNLQSNAMRRKKRK